MPIVRIGSNFSTLRAYNVNDDQNPFFVNSPHFTGYVTVRLRNHHYKGEPVIPTNKYFEKHRRFFSFQFQGRFKPTNSKHPDRLWTYDDILFCCETEGSVAPPMGTSLALKFARLIDPGFTADGIFLKKRPWAGSWLVCGMNVMKAWKAEQEFPKYLLNYKEFSNPANGDEEFCGEFENKPSSNNSGNSSQVSLASSATVIDESMPLLPVGPWTYYGANHLDEDTELLIPGLSHRLSSNKRRHYFLDPEIRRSHVFDPANVYACDFFNNFTDFSRMRADMFIKFNIPPVLKNQPLRFVCRDREGSSIFFVIEIDYQDLLDM